MAKRKEQNTAATPADAPTYQVLARRYRSRSFDELVGQDAIAKTLQNAIVLGRTAHAYLFCGTRGVGKTSMARIFARAINSEGSILETDAIGDAILKGQDMDVIEIDGASNRGVDDARNLIANAGISPTRSQYKVYIIDEVHMLTQPAFNALLKTMEEPPAHVKFILCTTEPHKVPATIQSRCQRFDFRTISAAKISAHLEHVLKSESIGWDSEAIAQVARLANGSMRDGLSVLERLVAASNGKITAELAREILGVPDEVLLDEIIQSVASANPSAALQAGARMVERGVSADYLLELLADRFRIAMVVSVCGETALPEDFSIEHCRPAFAASLGMATEDLVHAVALCDASSRTARTSSIPRAILDAILVRLALAERFATAGASDTTQKKRVVSALPATAPREVVTPRVVPAVIATSPAIPSIPSIPAIPVTKPVMQSVESMPFIRDLLEVFDASVVSVVPSASVSVARAQEESE
ncbi:MAG: DNA polymerase III subunit gamma/tau [Planctomycetota bacterium]|nr:DNA polymerase III subunit gamma/tau [Planctomycetota bacterium]